MTVVDFREVHNSGNELPAGILAPALASRLGADLGQCHTGGLFSGKLSIVIIPAVSEYIIRREVKE